MLERASQCIDSTTPLFIGRFEAPLRSHRLLGPRFWDNGSRQCDVPPWWPFYLDSIRKVPQTKGNNGRLGWANKTSSPESRPLERFSASWTNRYGQLKNSSAPLSRQYAQVALQESPNHDVSEDENLSLEQQEKEEEEEEEEEVEEKSQQDSVHQSDVEEDEFENNLDAQIEKDGRINNGSNLRNRTNRHEIELRNLFRMETEPESLTPSHFEQIWHKFVRLPEQEGMASRVLRFLSSSSRLVDLERALRAYSIIPDYNRDKVDYEAAISVAVKAKRGTVAAQICKEAHAKDFAQDCRQILLVDYLNRALWRSVASVWTTYFNDQTPIQEATVLDWTILDQAEDLPASVSMLCQRLINHDLFPRERRKPLWEVAHHLSYRIFASSYIMSRITASGVLQLLDLGRELRFQSIRHCIRAFNTLHSMHLQRNRADLMLMIFRNLRYRFPNSYVKPHVFGSLIEMCLCAGYSREIYEYLLEQFSKMHSKPDKLAYQRAMTALARQGDVQGVRSLFERFVQDYGLPQSLDFLTPAIYVYASIGDVKNTRAKLEELPGKFGIRPNTYCWNILMHAHTRSARPERAFTAFEEMKETGLEPDAYSFGTLMAVASNVGDTGTVYRLIEEAAQSNISGVNAMMDTIVHSLCLNDEAKEAETVADRATQANLQGSPTRMWNTLLRYHAFRADAKAMMRIQERMRVLNVKPDDMTYAALMTALVVRRRTNEAAKMLRILHLSNHLTVTPFHYAIVLFGYAQRGDRSMVSIIYAEMQQRFQKVNTSARLAKLNTQIERSWSKKFGPSKIPAGQNNPKFSDAVEYVTEMLLQSTNADLASKEPIPGSKRRRGRVGLRSIYMEFLVHALASNGRDDHARRLMQQYEYLFKTNNLDVDDYWQEGIELSLIRMKIATQQAHWREVENIWQEIAERIIEMAIPPMKKISKTTEPNLQVDSTAPTPTPTMLSEIDLQAGFSFHSPIEQKPERLFPLNEHAQHLVPAQKSKLAKPLSQYMHALDLQRRHSDIIRLIGDVQNAGFTLSSQNWNTYIQILCKSPDDTHQMLAFDLFDTILRPNAPSWDLLPKGKWNQVAKGSILETLDGAATPKLRKDWLRVKPNVFIPTYLTVIYLGTALIKFHRQAVDGIFKNLDTVQKKYPETLKLIQQTPYLRDRIQGVLLRGRTVIGDPIKLQNKIRMTNRAGILGSKSVLDYLPLEDLIEIDNEIRVESDTQEPLQFQQSVEEARLDKIVERIERQILNSSDRIDQQSVHEFREQRAKLLETLRSDLRPQQQYMANQRMGDPVIGVLPLDSHHENADKHSLLDSHHKSTQSETEVMNDSVRHIEESPVSALTQDPPDALPSAANGEHESPTTTAHALDLSILKEKKKKIRRNKYDMSILTRRILPSSFRSYRQRHAFTKNARYRKERRQSREANSEHNPYEKHRTGHSS